MNSYTEVIRHILPLSFISILGCFFLGGGTFCRISFAFVEARDELEARYCREVPRTLGSSTSRMELLDERSDGSTSNKYKTLDKLINYQFYHQGSALDQPGINK